MTQPLDLSFISLRQRKPPGRGEQKTYAFFRLAAKKQKKTQKNLEDIQKSSYLCRRNKQREHKNIINIIPIIDMKRRKLVKLSGEYGLFLSSFFDRIKVGHFASGDILFPDLFVSVSSYNRLLKNYSDYLDDVTAEFVYMWIYD